MENNELWLVRIDAEMVEANRTAGCRRRKYVNGQLLVNNGAYKRCMAYERNLARAPKITMTQVHEAKLRSIT